MQNNTLKKIYSIENIVSQSGDEKAADTWLCGAGMECGGSIAGD